MLRRASALVVLVLPLAACGGGGGAKSSAPTVPPVVAVKAAAKKTAQLRTMHVKLIGSFSTPAGNVPLRGSGDVDNVKHLALMHATVAAAGTGIPIDEVITGTTMYIKSPVLARGLPAGKTWMKLDLQKFGKAFGVNASELMSQNPSQSFAQLQAARDVTKIGPQQVDGVQTTHYGFHIDASKLPKAGKLQALTKAKFGPEEVWIDNGGYVRRMRIRYSLNLPSAGRQTQMLTMDFSSFGEAVAVHAPSSSQVFDATRLSIKGLGGR